MCLWEWKKVIIRVSRDLIHGGWLRRKVRNNKRNSQGLNKGEESQKDIYGNPVDGVYS